MMSLTNMMNLNALKNLKSNLVLQTKIFDHDNMVWFILLTQFQLKM